MTHLYRHDPKSALEAKHFAQIIAHGPILFQAARVLRERNILQTVADAGTRGITLEAIAAAVHLSAYGTRVLMEAGLGMYLFTQDEDGRYFLAKTGQYMLNDALTRVNMNFVQDVCYRAMFHLEDAIEQGTPAGLTELGDWDTVYEGLSQLPDHIRQSWFAYDHFFSDSTFTEIVKRFYRDNPIRRLLDIGGNTGKWAALSVRHDPHVHITLMDLPGQVDMARERIKNMGLSERVDVYPADILDASTTFPTGYDAVWMSQFLDCFSEEQIVSILQRAQGCLNENGHIWILEAFWDKQRFETAAFCLQQLSLYFTAIANGNSQMYDSRVFKRCIDQAGLEVVEEVDGLGLCHTLLKCRVR
ncbi:MAG: methyltransferase [Neisseria sp.]|nr:methyltransferase [Neisseria sp.]